MAKRINSTNLPPIGDIQLSDIEYALLEDLRLMSRESFWKNELFNEEHPQFLNKYSTEVSEYIIQYVNNRLGEYWDRLNPSSKEHRQ